MYVCMYVRICVGMYVSMYVCVCVCVRAISIYKVCGTGSNHFNLKALKRPNCITRIVYTNTRICALLCTRRCTSGFRKKAGNKADQGVKLTIRVHLVPGPRMCAVLLLLLQMYGVHGTI